MRNSLLFMTLRRENLRTRVLNTTSGCTHSPLPHIGGKMLIRSDSTRESLEEFKCPFTGDEVASLREEMEELTAWDARYFARREELLREMEKIVEGVVQTGIPCGWVRADCIDVEEYFAAAKDVMKDLRDKAEESRSSLTKKMQVSLQIWRLIVGM